MYSSPFSVNSSLFWYYSVTFLIALAVVLLSTPGVRAVALKYGYVDLPSARKVHQQPIARLGGISICIGTLAALIILWLLVWFDWFPANTLTDILAVVLGSIGFFLIGLVDDLYGLSPIIRLFLQSAIAGLTWIAGVQIEFTALPGLGLVQLNWLSLPLTILWLVGVVNAINWIDGLDGLASGVAGIAAAVSFVICLYTGQFAAAMVMVALLGSLLGFLVYNFNPAQIFMGDGGSYFIGFLLAGMGVVGLVKSATATAILLPLLVLAVPLLDMSVVILSRLCKGNSPFIADKRHLHHRLLRTGLSHRHTVLMIYTLSLWGGSLAILFVGIPSSPVILSSATGLLGCMTWRALRSLRQN
jgi:UDP-N-acetylmuramyl pentapeptide phosphotransferase/UDP-N-acetylglucosamine-1-phosphate transferase